MILKNHCSYCKKSAVILRTDEDKKSRTLYLDCLHTQTTYFVQPQDVQLHSLKGEELFPFQKEGVSFAINSGLRCLINDEMGLGKTCQGLGAVHISKSYPCLIVVKAGLRIQWLKQTINWTGNVAQIISQEGEPNLGFKFVIVSIDLLHRFKDKEKWVQKFGFKCAILDECQAIKNHSAKRTNAVREIFSSIPHLITLSGTPIKNNALEYFPVLNLARPDVFPVLAQYERQYCDRYWNGYGFKVGGIKDPVLFKNHTKDFILRRSREEVLPDLPKIFRNTQFEELGKDVEAAYQTTLREFQDYYNSSTDAGSLARHSNILAYLVKMRHLTGLSKIQGVADYIEEFLTETSKKIVVFLHHKDVNTLLVDKLNQVINSWPSEFGLPVLTLQSEHSAFERSDIVDQFATKNHRVLIASTLAAGEGVDGIQDVCSDILIMERQWNPANEEQVEGRIERMGQKENKITSTYFIATGTIDEFFAEIVERKRGYLASTLDGKEYAWDQSSIISELAADLAAKGGKKWSW